MLIFLLFAARKTALAGWLIGGEGQLIYESEGEVLGKPERVQERQAIRAQDLAEKASKIRLEHRYNNRLLLRLENAAGEEIELVIVLVTGDELKVNVVESTP